MDQLQVSDKRSENKPGRMLKEIELKEDGRTLIYYSFAESESARSGLPGSDKKGGQNNSPSHRTQGSN